MGVVNEETEKKRFHRLEAVVKRTHDQTPAAYMQVVGIVQSVALSYLAFRIVGSFRNGEFSDQGWETLVLQYSCVFQLIVLTWHVNVQNVMAFKLLDRILDSYIPFTFAFPVYFMIETSRPLELVYWLFSIAFFMVLSVIAYVHLWSTTTSKSASEHNRTVAAAVNGYFGCISLYISVAGLVAVIFALFATNFFRDTARPGELVLIGGCPSWIAPLAMNVMVFVFTLMHMRLFWAKVFAVAPIAPRGAPKAPRSKPRSRSYERARPSRSELR